jgi:hypothetical protein
MFNYKKNNKLLFSVNVNNMSIIKTFMEKIKIYQLLNNLTDKKLINLIDNNMLVSTKTIADIEISNFVIFGKSGELRLNKVNAEIFFQILNNNYLHKPSKLVFLNFIANNLNQHGFLNLLETQLSLSCMEKKTAVEITDRALIIDLNNYSEEILNKKYSISQPIKIIEYFKITGIKIGDVTKTVSATLGLLSKVELYTDPAEVSIEEVFIYAEPEIASKIAHLLEDTLDVKQEIYSKTKELDLFGVKVVYPLFFSLKQKSICLAQQANNQNYEENKLSDYFSKLRLC